MYACLSSDKFLSDPLHLALNFYSPLVIKDGWGREAAKEGRKCLVVKKHQRSPNVIELPSPAAVFEADTEWGNGSAENHTQP